MRTVANMVGRSTALVYLVIVVALASLAAGCGRTPTGKVSYHPPFTPIEISINTNGEVSFSAGAEWVTPIGTFGIGADLDPPSDDTTQLVIAHPRASGQAVQDRYSISSADTLGVCFNGSIYGEFSNHRIYLNAFEPDSTIRIVPSGTACPRPAQQRVQPEPVSRQGSYEIVRVQVGTTPLNVFVADTPEKIARGMTGVSRRALGNVDGMLYLLPAPQSFNPANDEGAFIFPGYLFATEVHFFDANARYWAGGPVTTCSADRSNCRPYFASLYNYPVPYQYVLELVSGRLGSVPMGTPLQA